MITTNKRGGFTLVELAIVIVIIGFLVAGIAAGSNMIKQAELRSMITDLQSYQTAYNNFLGRYNAVPGDMAVGSSYFAACGDADTNCNGDGNGIILHTTDVTTNETRMAWKQLASAGMIGAGIDPINTADANPGSLTIGTRAPASKKSGVGFMMAGGDTNIGAAIVSSFPASTNAVYIGSDGGTTEGLVVGALNAEDAFSIDVKLDDGLVSGSDFTGYNTGVVQVMEGSGATGEACILTTIAVPKKVTGYNVGQTESACVLGLALN